MSEVEAAREEVQVFQKQVGTLREEIARVIVGNREVVDGVITCVLAGSHALLEGVPGLGKTMLVRTLAESLALDFSRMSQASSGEKEIELGLKSGCIEVAIFGIRGTCPSDDFVEI